MPIDDERSPLWSFGATAALGAGVGYGIYKNRSAFASAWKAGGQDIAGNVAARVKDISGFNPMRPSPSQVGLVGETFEAMLGNYQRTSSLGIMKSDIRQAAYESILRGGKTSHKEALSFLSAIDEQQSAVGAYKTAVNIVQKAQGDISILESNVRGLGNEFSYTKPFLSEAMVQTGRIGILKTPDITIADLEPEAQEQAKRIRQIFSSAAGEKYNIDWKFKTVSETLGSKKLTTPMMLGQIEGETLRIPLAKTGFTYGGENLTARYITRGAYLPGGNHIDYTDLYARTMSQAIERSKTSTSLKANLQRAEQSLIEQMNIRDSAERAAAVWALPADVMTSGGLAKARLTSQEAVAFGVPSAEVENILGRGLYPYTSPTAAGKGTLTKLNLTEELYGPLGKWMSAEQRPTQFIRSEWGVSEAAKRAAQPFKGTFGKYFERLGRKVKGSGYERLLYGEAPALSGKAYSSPQLMTFYAKPSTKSYGIGYRASALNQLLSGEEGVIFREISPIIENERIIQKKITMAEGLKVNQELFKSLENQPVGAGVKIFGEPIGKGSAFIGIEQATGRELFTSIEGGIKTELIAAELTGENTATVFLKERRQLSGNEMWKFFSEDNKFMASAKDQREFNKYLRAAEADKLATHTGQKIEALFSGELVQRNKAALFNQQIEAMGMVLGHRIDTNKIAFNREAEKFLRDPMSATGANKILEIGDLNAEYALQKRLIRQAKKFGFTSQEMASTFGLMDENILQQMISKRAISPADAKAIRESAGVFGLGKLRLGDLAVAGGAGRRGSFEQTGFRLLSMKGEEGERFAAELVQRLEGKGQLSAADKMLATAIGEESLFAGAAKKLFSPEEKLQLITDIAEQDLIREEGRFISLGQKFSELGGSSRLYVPGLKEAPAIVGSMVTPKGDVIRSPVVRELQHFRGIMRGGATGAELEEAAKGLRTAIARATEQQATARGKVFGSKILTGTRSAITEQSDTFRVSTRTMQQMYDDLLSRATTEEQQTFLRQQIASLEGGGVAVGGMWRHPTTGPESFQFVRFQVDTRLADGMLQAPKKFGRLDFAGGRQIDVDVSEMVGFKGDFDRDHFVLAAISDRDTYTRVSKKIDNEMRDGYTKYLFNHYAMKDIIDERKVKTNITKLTQEQALTEGYRKLTTAKTTTGRVNLALQKLKIGMAHTAPKEYRPMAELFWHLEEAAIGGKHGVLGTELYEGITSAVENKDVGKLEGVIESLLGSKRTIAGTITDAYGNVMSHELKYDPRQWAEVAIGAVEAAGQDVDVAMRAASFAKGTSPYSPKVNELAEMYYARRTGSVDVAQSLAQAAAGTTDEFTTKASRLMRRGQTRATALVGALKKAGKPMLLGAAAAAGIAMMAPAISGRLKAGADGGRNLPPGDDQGMSPPPPRPLTPPKAYDIGGGRTLNRATIRMRMNDLNNNSKDFMRSARALSASGNVNVNTRDDRSLLDPRMLASKIHERL